MSFDTLEDSRYSAQPVHLYLIRGAEGTIGPLGLNDGESVIVRDGVTYQPWPIKCGDITQDGTLDKSDIKVTLALGTEVDELFLAYPPSQVVNLVIFEGHVNDTVTLENYPAVWMGRITGAANTQNEIELSCVPVSTSIKRVGLRVNYQIGCPHVLYGEACRANKAAATVSRNATEIHRNRITIDATVNGTGADATAVGQRYVGGLLEWTDTATGRYEIRTISAITNGGTVVTIRGSTRGIGVGTTLSVVRGCNRQMTGCNTHNNIHNYGGQPFIPLENPLSQKNQFY
ncbi:phage BR0599 family protein [Manganibacter manganicus]|uniref:Bacteriophage phiJL001 Gp84 C-terminal domain-containing protein n=1 Tax=Manganibacter manganicus TaxID=1873176 RepID=A0A1V8RR24_9HYPH|nr:phage BR0599 family protein [Pseudaminobacter manganicus]OQM75605.1 hypothetical protein BFN67_17690 [Pseudaminobacter manganicus]